MPLFPLEYFLQEEIRKAIKLLQQVQTISGVRYWGCFSGGKDSCVIKQLALEAGVDVEWHYSNTTMDPPELVRYIRKDHSDVIIQHPPMALTTRMVQKGLAPTRRIRWCCSEYKETKSPKDSYLLMGVRHTESPARKKKWQKITYLHKSRSYVVAPILTWSDKMVWSFIHLRSMSYCSLYDEGFDRLGCIGCPLAGKKKRRLEFDRWPGYERIWKRAFQRMWNERKGTMVRNGKEWHGSQLFDTWEDMWRWWASDDPLPSDGNRRNEEKCQGLLDMYSM